MSGNVSEFIKQLLVYVSSRKSKAFAFYCKNMIVSFNLIFSTQNDKLESD